MFELNFLTSVIIIFLDTWLCYQSCTVQENTHTHVGRCTVAM